MKFNKNNKLSDILAYLQVLNLIVIFLMFFDITSGYVIHSGCYLLIHLIYQSIMNEGIFEK